MHNQGILDVPSLIQVLLGAAAVKDDRGVGAAAGGSDNLKRW
jgi:hypothetical protein